MGDMIDYWICSLPYTTSGQVLWFIEGNPPRERLVSPHGAKSCPSLFLMEGWNTVILLPKSS